MKQLGNRLRTLREGLGISQAKFAEIIGVNANMKVSHLAGFRS